MDEYEVKFNELSHFTLDMDRNNDIHKCRMFEDGLRDEIKTPVAVGLFSEYSRCVKSVCTMERATLKPKVKET